MLSSRPGRDQVIEERIVEHAMPLKGEDDLEDQHFIADHAGWKRRRKALAIRERADPLP